jgi:hypothetical protein
MFYMGDLGYTATFTTLGDIRLMLDVHMLLPGTPSWSHLTAQYINIDDQEKI